MACHYGLVVYIEDTLNCGVLKLISDLVIEGGAPQLTIIIVMVRYDVQNYVH